MTNSKASSGIANLKPKVSIMKALNGVNTTPPSDNPVEATDNATARRRRNHRVTKVVAGIRADAAKPAPKTT